MLRHPALLTLLTLGLANLAVGLIVGLRDVVPTTRIVLDVVDANFGLVASAIAILCSAYGAPARRGVRLASRVTAVALATFASLTVAGVLAITFQLVRGQTHLQLPLYAHGLYFNLGWQVLHLAALAVAVRALFGSSSTRGRWFAVAATVFLWLASNLAFEHPLLRFGAPKSPWSDLAGYGPYLGWHIAVGAYWSALCVLLLVIAHVVSRKGKPLRSRLTANSLATAWAAVVVAFVTGGWIVVNAGPDAGETTRVSAAQASLVQPEYSRLDLRVDIFPEERGALTRGTAIVVNRHDVDIPVIHFTIPAALDVGSISLTGELAEQGPSYRRYRLNRPLEPGETLLVEFRASLIASGPPRLDRLPRLLANGTFLHTTDLMPLVGDVPSATNPVAFRARISTTLDQIAVAPGELTRSWREEGRAYVEYQSARPIPLLVSIHAGRYAVAHAQWRGVAIEAYHHPGHRVAVPALLAVAKRELLRQAPAEFSRFRVVEVPDFEPFVRRPQLLALGPILSATKAVAYRHRLSLQPPPSYQPVGLRGEGRQVRRAGSREHWERLASTGVLPYSEVAAFVDEPSPDAAVSPER